MLLMQHDKAIELSAKKILGPVRDAAGKMGVPCETIHAKEQYPVDGIIETARARGCDLIVMASHGRRGVAKLLMGSQAAKVMAYSPIPVLVCR
jgi:nucleotide-binding universal stress UspA family protein